MLRSNVRACRAGLACARLSAVVAAWALAVPGGVVEAQTGDTLRLTAAISMARAGNPLLQSARLRADAAAERVAQRGAWENPTVAVGLMNRPLDGFGTSEPMTKNAIQVAQRIPWPGKLGFASEGAQLMADADAFDADEVERQLTARLQGAYYRIAFLDRALAVMRETRELLRNFHEVSEARYAVGEGLQQDVLQAQVTVAQMTEEITVKEQERLAEAARLNALLGRPASVAVPAVELPLPGPALPDADTLVAHATVARPGLVAAELRTQAADARYRAARRELYPDFLVSLEYGQRPQYADMLSVMVGVSVPLWAGSRQLPMRREYEALRLAEEQRAIDVRNETHARVIELRAAAERARTLSALYATDILPQARTAVESAFAAYRAGSVDYMTLIQNQLTVHRYEIETWRLAAEYGRVLGELDALTAAGIGGGI
jgi:outer membrane protein TolC